LEAIWASPECKQVGTPAHRVEFSSRAIPVHSDSVRRDGVAVYADLFALNRFGGELRVSLPSFDWEPLRK
jgi:hypothetical protein